MPNLDEFIVGLDSPQREISERLRGLLDAALDSAVGQVWHGHPVWLDGKTPVAGFKPYPKYVTFMIWNASPITDSSDTLVAGPRMATIKYASADEIDDARVSDWLRQSQS
ncbi:DUF1801 domain-containing protein [Lysinibacter cavernae]|uniref:YdhG-like domain-containing protein n=1 Tax=Lysinibacter cavernae TaxID=1640652 RepID=A0A7X5TU28_9MICO|nr:DUF1801 domain-containing protein [Lysinibacter cavernae]NIH54820.1 hypothetical protein [Lysinibacter cavernae]